MWLRQQDDDSWRVDRIAERIKDQAWDGFEAVDGLPGKVRGVKTTRAFQQHEVVYDYNGQLLNHKEGYYYITWRHWHWLLEITICNLATY